MPAADLITNTALPADFLRDHFDLGMPYAEYVLTGEESHQSKWAEVHGRIKLTPEQTTLVKSFTRQMKVLVTSGTWCGDCAAQCPMLARIAEANPDKIDLRFVDRDEHRELSDRIVICQGLRVPTVVFMAEDFEFAGLTGDRTLTRYRAVASKQLGAACPLPGAPIPDDELGATLQDWVDEFERIALLLRLSPRLREIHGD